MTFFRFFDMGTTSVEVEAGHTINEPVNYAVRVAIEQAVVELIKAGEKRELWKFDVPESIKLSEEQQQQVIEEVESSAQ
jgi:hypothetical protein